MESDYDKATRLFHMVIGMEAKAIAVFGRQWCPHCGDKFGTDGPGTARDRNWDKIGFRVCPRNQPQQDLFGGGWHD
jgi:hypothetical protein